MSPRWRRSSRSALLTIPLSITAVGCADPGSDDDTSGTGDTGTDSDGAIGWFELGWGVGQFTPVADGDALPIVRGGQGAEMIPLPLQGGEWFLPDTIVSWMDETGPMVDLVIDIEGYNDGVGGHFKRLANYTLDWIVLEDGTYQSSYIPVIIPDGIDSAELEGLPAHIEVSLRPFEQPTLALELDVVITVMTDLPPV
ncbi:MAG: hypothetical protein H6712_21440 [Myxococcales bacterium]|nr:hypothetical protein [Myxococcales bacterium]MCB9716441.1 hypothetical protein [Myxococcales bacterium]